MAEFTQLSNAPIQEGLIDLRTTFATLPSREALAALADELKPLYPESVVLNRYETQIQISNDKASSQSANRFAGLRLTSVDKGFVFQAQVDGFTVSRLRPYSSWENLLREAKLLWAAYEKYTKPQTISRVAVRYINRFEIPVPVANFEEYFTVPPNLPPVLPQVLSRYLVRLEIPDGASGAMILLTQAMEEVTGSSAVFVLDIDVFKLTEIEVTDSTWWDLLENLRNLKNRVFFSLLTEKALEPFK